MSKRAPQFERRPRDFYATPPAALAPLVPHLDPGTPYVEPCAGDGALIDGLRAHNIRCSAAYDIEPQRQDIEQRDALAPWSFRPPGTLFITNPPWARTILHPLIESLTRAGSAWLLFDADWMHTRQAAPYLPYCNTIVSVGRVKWIVDSPNTGKDNAAWYLFTPQQRIDPTQFHGRT